MTNIELLNIVAIFSSPAVAVIVSLWIGEKMRWKNYKKEREDKILEKLIAFRYAMPTHDFLSALNSIILAFHQNGKIKELVKNLHRAYANNEDSNIINQRIVELIYEICKYKKYNITEHEIYNLFKSNPLIPQKFPQQPTNPSSTLGNNSETVISKTESSVNFSITAGYLSDF